MAHRVPSKFIAAAVLGLFLLAFPANALRGVQRDSNLISTPPISESGYTVPLEGSRTCNSNGQCTSTLPGPPANKILKYLAIARGIVDYSCAGRKPFESPYYVGQATSLWDAAPLIPHIADEELFHTIIPQLYEFDYTELANSSLVCIGAISTKYGASVVDLFDVESFAVNIQQLVNAPEVPHLNLEWAHEASTNLAWDVYRVETVSGKPPTTCVEQNATIQLDYAAEYWFYHT